MKIIVGLACLMTLLYHLITPGGSELDFISNLMMGVLSVSVFAAGGR